MTHVIGIAVTVLLVALLIWLLTPTKKSTDGSPLAADERIDPTDARQIGVLVGLSGGQIADAATAQFALRRFEEIHHRKATVRDMGTVVGLSQSIRIE